MKLTLHWVDAFTDRVFAGNPAAVVKLDEWLEDSLMQRIAFENGLAETAFLVRTGPARYHLRWFTPALEVDLCGHATLASAFVLFTQFGETGDTVTFDSLSGPLVVRRSGEKFELDFPSRRGVAVSASTVTAEVRQSIPAAHPEYWWRMGENPWFIAAFATASEVAALKPAYHILGAEGDSRLIATAPGDDCDFVYRFFAPGAGIPEDPVTGSAQCSLVPLWAERLGKSTLCSRQISPRGGQLWSELVAATATTPERVKIAGHAVLYLRGEILV